MRSIIECLSKPNKLKIDVSSLKRKMKVNYTLLIVVLRPILSFDGRTEDNNLFETASI